MQESVSLYANSLFLRMGAMYTWEQEASKEVKLLYKAYHKDARERSNFFKLISQAKIL
jgi:hypothetical protein